MSFVTRDDHAETARDFVIQFFQNKPAIEAFINAYAAQTQELEYVLSDLCTKRTVFVAVGAQLDVVGKLVGEARNGASDDIYRLRILARIIANSSSGTNDDLVQALKLLLEVDQGTADTSFQVYTPLGSVAQVFVIIDAVLNSTDAVCDLLRDIRAAGVSLYLFSDTGDVNDFLLGDLPIEQNDFLNGFGSLPINDTGGGCMATVAVC